MRAVAGQDRGQGDIQAHPLIDSLQGLIGIIAGLGLANALAVFFEPDAHHSIRSGGLFAALADNGRALDPAINWLLPVASLLLLFVLGYHTGARLGELLNVFSLSVLNDP